MREVSGRERLTARWHSVNAQLERLSAARDFTPEGDAVGSEERSMLEKLDHIEGQLGGIHTWGDSGCRRTC